MSFRFAIIGAGLTGTSMFCQFVQNVRLQTARQKMQTAKIEILIFEKQEIFGPGFPHGDRFVMPYHITNMCDHDMGIIAGKPEDFQQWVNANRSHIEAYADSADAAGIRSNASADHCRHYPRAVMGEYLKARFQETRQAARDLDIPLQLYPQVEVTDLKKDGHQLLIQARRLQSGEVFFKKADRVLLATGHWFEASDRKHYFTSPWPARDLLRGIPAGEHVGVIGTSLSAIETVLTLTSDGGFRQGHSGELVFVPSEDTRRIALYSRRGMLPRVRGRNGTYRNRHLTRENLIQQQQAGGGFLTLEQVFGLLNADLESAYGRPFAWSEIVNPCGSPAELLQQYLKAAKTGDGPHGELIWQTVLHQSFPLAREVYLSLSAADRARFEQEFATLFFVNAATQPTINAEKILALLKSGIVSVHKLGADYRFFKDEAADRFVFSYRDEAGNPKRAAYRYIVNARGQEKSLKTNPSELIQNLLKSRTVQTEERIDGEQPLRPANNTGKDLDPENYVYQTGSVWIDPASQRIVTTGADGAQHLSDAIYAVGAMTRGQILDASMAYGIARSTALIAADLADSLAHADRFH